MDSPTMLAREIKKRGLRWTKQDTLDFFGVSSAQDITWGHAINSRDELDSVLRGDGHIMFLESDVRMGTCGECENLPIMAHPPATQSDLTFDNYLQDIVHHNRTMTDSSRRVGIKLDFKDAAALRPCLIRLREVLGEEELKFPVWLNADIFWGPAGKQPAIDPESFLRECAGLFPSGTLSPGFTTGPCFKDPVEAAERLITDQELVLGYSKTHLQVAERLLGDDLGHVTLPLQSTMMRVGGNNVVEFLQRHPDYTVTLWGEQSEEDAAWLASTHELQGRIFLDVKTPGVETIGLNLAPELFNLAKRGLVLVGMSGVVSAD
mmetsp:Transcript_15122/g.36933  ORF Transcript_15122/g.36933 Transcript_15122/m.36933 type:complete len:320 (+) Transcript_15122:54-1013(+)